MKKFNIFNALIELDLQYLSLLNFLYHKLIANNTLKDRFEAKL